jgi:hypothetical protein
MSFTNQKPLEVTPEQHRAFTRLKKRFGCALCNHVFNVGDIARFVYANGTKDAHCGNFFVCKECDSGDVLEKGIENFKIAQEGAIRWGIYGPDWQ